MNKKILFVAPLGWLLTGCAMQQQVPPIICDPYPVPNCSGNNNAQAPTINLNTQSLMVNPGCVDADKSTTLVFMLTPMGGKNRGDVEIFPKDKVDSWLAGTNNGNADFIFIPIPAGTAAGIYEYGIKIGSKCVDPRVRVR